ncbi:hypothetical protein Nepgr_001425 [Nepenthes gracilis]|uniref:Uncharacterized protein n=1 Tax=Nepenthes gracilis TaxID=150966 RepID=A0AAD3RXG4_NEPGR|nr:hypothetical protein Nepgr_001425 [Nepenthes gracilis]
MGEDLFEDLPPPSHQPIQPIEQPEQKQSLSLLKITETKEQPPLPLKSALKRPKPPVASTLRDSGSEKRLKFKTTTDASEAQVIEAMQRIASHIKNPAKISKASKLAIQLIQAKSVKPETSDHFFGILEAAMSSSTSCNDASVRADYHLLFSAAQDAVECLNKLQKNQLVVWTIRAVVANDLYTDDSFVFSRAAGRIKELISNLPVATEEDDMEEAVALEDETDTMNVDGEKNQDISSVASTEGIAKEESDPFGLDALILSKPKKHEKTKGKKETTTRIRKEEEDETKRFLKSQREALVNCLEIAAKRYKIPWCQTVIDILAKHAFDNVSKFTACQRNAIEKLWASVREQHIFRKQGKSLSGKLDVNAFEWLQQKYANEKISIRHAVGASGDRQCEQWLG